MSLRTYPIILTDPDQDGYHIISLLSNTILSQEEQEEPDTRVGYESATVSPPIQGLYQPIVVYDYPAIDYNTIWGPRYITSKCSTLHTIKNCVKDDCVEHIIMDENNKIQEIYITSKPNIYSKQKISNEKICSICTDNFDIDDNILNDCCLNKCCYNHFHTSCMNKWILKNFEQNKCPSCPLCRKSIDTNYNLSYNNLYSSLSIVRRLEREIDNVTLGQITHNVQNSNSNTNQILNEFNVGSINYRYELNLETKIYSIYDVNSGELKMTLPKSDVDLVIDQSFCTLKRAISTLVEFSGNVVDTIMEITG